MRAPKRIPSFIEWLRFFGPGLWLAFSLASGVCFAVRHPDQILPMAIGGLTVFWICASFIFREKA